MLRTDSTCSALRHHVIVALTRRAARRERGRSYPAISSALHRTLRPQKEQACTAARTTLSLHLEMRSRSRAISDDLERDVGHGLDVVCVS